MADARAASFRTRSIKGSAKLAGLRLAMSMLDLTTLEGKDTPEKVRALCRKALNPGRAGAPPGSDVASDAPPVAAVCVYPSLVPVAKEALAGSAVKVAAVATGFPSGQYPLKVRLADAADAVRAGADEIDMVINRGAFLSGRTAQVGREIVRFKEVCGPAHLKVILETGELETYDNVRRASEIAIAAGADFIKTSTGKVQPAATMPVTLVMLEAIRAHALATGKLVGLKPAGGISTAKLALHYLVMVKETMDGVVPGANPWLTPRYFRFGASALANDLLRQIAFATSGRYAAAWDFAEA
ncbi:MAG TPA: deoxyribose-phosphate aldolase [Phycisphaerales bacterium]|nr:deoxyribose-phosphate aldolase [Phycisphaerales bacterium]